MCTPHPDTLRAGVSFGAEMEMSELVRFLSSPFSGVLVKHVISAGGSIGCVRTPAEDATCSRPRAHGRVMPAQRPTSQRPPATVVQEHMVKHERTA